MEKENLCSKSDSQLIKALAETLVKYGITEGSDVYYTDEDYNLPFFKIPKAYKKETPDDPDVHYIFIDVNDSMLEYTVHGNYVHEHIDDADKAVELVMQLLNAEVVEVAIVYPDRIAGFFVNNTGDPQANVDIVVENFETIKYHIDRDLGNFNGGHMHVLFQTAATNYFMYGPTTRHRLQGINIYLVSAVFAEHPEFYVIQ